MIAIPKHSQIQHMFIPKHPAREDGIKFLNKSYQRSPLWSVWKPAPSEVDQPINPKMHKMSPISPAEPPFFQHEAPIVSIFLCTVNASKLL